MKDHLDLHALADGELSAAERTEVEARLKTCAVSSKTYESVQNLKTVVGEKVEPVTCLKTWAKCTERLDELEKRRKAERFVSKYAWSMCAGIALMIGFVGVFNRAAGGSHVATGDVARMVAGLSPLSQRAPQDRSVDMSQWLRDVSQGAPVGAQANSLQPVSYSQGIVDNRFVTIVNFQDVAGQVSLVIVKGAERVDGMTPQVGRSSYNAGQIDQMNCVSWTERGFSLLLVGDRPHEELGRLADTIRGQ